MNKRHCHNFSNIIEWITEPTEPKDVTSYACYTVLSACDCGQRKKRQAEYSELKNHIEKQTCKYCKKFGQLHSSQEECIQNLLERVFILEEKLELICDKFSDFKNAFRNINRDHFDY